MTDRRWSDIDPIRQATGVARPALPKRFYRVVGLDDTEGGLVLTLDGRPARTPGKRPLAMPTRALADAVAAEWRAQEGVIDPSFMPVTRAANTVIDGVADQMEAVRDEVVRFAGTDLVCYRAERPESLCQRQADAWDPVVEWAARRLGARPVLAGGIIHVDQPPEIGTGARAMTEHLTPFQLAGVYTVTVLTGSALIALALLEGAIDAEQAWTAAHVDEDWQIEQWGEDEEAMARRAQRRTEFDAAILGLAPDPA